MLLVTGLANIGFAAVYAGLGASAEGDRVSARLCASLAIPGLALIAANRASFEAADGGGRRTRITRPVIGARRGAASAIGHCAAIYSRNQALKRCGLAAISARTSSSRAQ